VALAQHLTDLQKQEVHFRVQIELALMELAAAEAILVEVLEHIGNQIPWEAVAEDLHTLSRLELTQ
jgi:hypothetical protein